MVRSTYTTYTTLCHFWEGLGCGAPSTLSRDFPRLALRLPFSLKLPIISPFIGLKCAESIQNNARNTAWAFPGFYPVVLPPRRSCHFDRSPPCRGTTSRKMQIMHPSQKEPGGYLPEVAKRRKEADSVPFRTEKEKKKKEPGGQGEQGRNCFVNVTSKQTVSGQKQGDGTNTSLLFAGSNNCAECE